MKMRVKKDDYGVRSWRNRKNPGKGMNQRVGLTQKKNTSSSKIKYGRTDEEVCGFVRVVN